MKDEREGECKERERERERERGGGGGGEGGSGERERMAHSNEVKQIYTNSCPKVSGSYFCYPTSYSFRVIQSINLVGNNNKK